MQASTALRQAPPCPCKGRAFAGRGSAPKPLVLLWISSPPGIGRHSTTSNKNCSFCIQVPVIVRYFPRTISTPFALVGSARVFRAHRFAASPAASPSLRTWGCWMFRIFLNHFERTPSSALPWESSGPGEWCFL